MIGRAPTRDGRTVEIEFRTDDGPHVARFDVPADLVVDDGADATLALGWFPAMARREPLHVDGPVSPRLLGAAERIAEIWLTWDRAIHTDNPWYGRVELTAADTHPSATAGRGAACFFTGGVDSFHSALALRDRLDALIFVHGFDLLDDSTDPLNLEVSERLRESADSIGLALIEVECNLVAFAAGSGIGWDDFHGAALAAVAHLLGPQFDTVYVPATSTYDRLYPLGSHPLLDPLWSSERVEIVHHGADATRVDKVRAIADHPAARRHLRVCQENADGQYNCGACEKCVRTAVAIRLAGVEGQFATLPPPSLRQIAAVDIRGLGSTWHGYADELRRSGASPRLRRAIDLALARHRLRSAPGLGRWLR